MTEQKSTPDSDQVMSAQVAQALAELGLAGRAEVLAPDEPAPQVAFLEDEGPMEDLPPFPNTTNIGRLYGWQPGDTLEEAMARHQQQER